MPPKEEPEVTAMKEELQNLIKQCKVRIHCTVRSNVVVVQLAMCCHLFAGKGQRVCRYYAGIGDRRLWRFAQNSRLYQEVAQRTHQ